MIHGATSSASAIKMTAIRLVGLLVLGSIGLSEAWSLMPIGSLPLHRTNKGHLKRSSPVRLYASRNDKDKVSTTACAMRRLGLTGVSVSDHGFAVLWGLRSNNDKQDKVYWPWYVTSAQAGDKRAVTSAQALTLCQLIAGIDLAGSRLPADILAQMTVLSCERQQEEKDDDSTTITAADPGSAMTAERLVSEMQRQVQRVQRQWFPKEAADSSSQPLTYTKAPSWIRARVRLPLCTLDQIIVEPDQDGQLQVSFHVHVRDYGSLVVHHVTNQVLADVLGPLYDDYTFSDETRRGFLTTALSLRYKAPVLLEQPTEAVDEDMFVHDVIESFPMYRTVAKVQTPSDRVVSQIEESWKVHQLQAAYQIALKKNDMKAVAKIRAKLDEMEEMTDLPVQPESELDSMQ